ncbi:MAG: YceI family protein [SAR324 cluster bacterium]|nr:YceI family protein [SAR324 cluster bacterium]
MKKLITIFTTSILFTLSVNFAFAEEPIFAPEEHCLAYKTEKVMFLFADVEVIGKSCELTTIMHWNTSGDLAKIEVSVPVNSLDSGNTMRDKDIPNILKAELTPKISFISEWLKKSVWEEMLAGQRPKISGNLEVAGGVFPVKFNLSFAKQDGYFLVEGHLKTTFSALKVTVPAVVGGLLAEPGNELELLLHLRTDKISGAEKIVVQE